MWQWDQSENASLICKLFCLVRIDRGRRASIAGTAATSTDSARLDRPVKQRGPCRAWQESDPFRAVPFAAAARIGDVGPLLPTRAHRARGDGGRGAGAGGGGRAVLRGGRGVAGRGQDAEHVRQRLRRHGQGHGGARAARGRRAVQPPPPLRPRRRRPPPRPHRPRIGAAAEHAVEGVPGRQHEPAGPAVHRGEAVGDPATQVDQGERVPRQQRRRAVPRLQDHRQLPRGRLRRLPRRLRHRHRQDRPPLQRRRRAAGEEHVHRHRQPGHRLRLHRRARRHPRRDVLPAMTLPSVLVQSLSLSLSSVLRLTQNARSVLCLYLVAEALLS